MENQIDNYEDSDEIDLLIYALIQCEVTKVSGLGQKTATAISVYYGSFNGFLAADEASLRTLKNSKGQQIVKDNLIPQILNLIEQLPKGYSVRETWIRMLVWEFFHKQLEMLEKLSLNSLMINPFLVKALGLNTPEEIILFNLYQTVTRSIVTSWGHYVEQILRRSGAKEITEKNSGFDLQKRRADTMYYLQIKSSPNSMNVDTIRHLNRKVKELQEHRENYKTVLGLTFGTQAQVSAQITHYIDESVTRILTGKELWEFVSEEANFHSRVLDIISEIVEDGPLKPSHR